MSITAIMRIRKNPYPIVIIIALVVLFLFLAKGVWGVYDKKMRSAENLDKAEQELTELQNRENALGADIDRINTRHGIESEIVTKYNVAKEGEQVVHILDEQDAEVEVKVEEKGFWARFWGRIF